MIIAAEFIIVPRPTKMNYLFKLQLLYSRNFLNFYHFIVNVHDFFEASNRPFAFFGL